MEQSKEIGRNEGTNEHNPKSKSVNIATWVHRIWALQREHEKGGGQSFPTPFCTW